MRSTTFNTRSLLISCIIRTKQYIKCMHHLVRQRNENNFVFMVLGQEQSILILEACVMYVEYMDATK